MHRNLISISQLVTAGCRVNTTQGEDYEVTHGEIVMMKGEVSNGIYCLLGTTVKALRYEKHGETCLGGLIKHSNTKGDGDHNASDRDHSIKDPID